MSSPTAKNETCITKITAETKQQNFPSNKQPWAINCIPIFYRVFIIDIQIRIKTCYIKA